MIIEIPAHSDPVKYEVDHDSGAVCVDRFMATAMFYPCNYGYIPNTLGDDGDPLDVLVLMQEPVVPLTIVRARAIGGLRMRDDKGGDDKIIAVAVHDPAMTGYHDLGDLPPHTMREIRRFFEDYKALEHKEVIIEDLHGAAEAHQVILRALELYQAEQPR